MNKDDKYNLGRIRNALDNPCLSSSQRKTLKRYEMDLRINRGFRISTVTVQILTLKGLGTYLGKDFQAAGEEDLMKFLGSLEIANSTLQLKKYVVRTFFTWLGKGDVVKNVKVLHTEKRIRKEELITEEEYERMIEAVNKYRQTSEIQKLRNLVLLIALKNTGGRINEILRTGMKDVVVMPFGVKLMVHEAKTPESEERPIYILDHLDIVLRWIKRNKSEWFIPCMHRGQGYLDRSDALRIIKRIAEKAGIEKNIYCHLFRHFKATNLEENFVEQKIINMLLGWSPHSKMPQRYQHIIREKFLDKWMAENYGSVVIDNGQLKLDSFSEN